MTITLYLCATFLFGALLLALRRMALGPSTMDRAVALDVVTACAIGLLIVTMALTGRTDLVPVLVVLALVGFVGSTTISRFAVPDREAEARMLSEEEVRVLLAAEEMRRDEDAAVHDPDEEGL